MYRHILIATDGSELADRGLDHGLALAKAVGAAVTIVTVTENEYLSPYAMAIDFHQGHNPVEAQRDAQRALARGILDRAAARAEAAGVTFSAIHVAERPPAEGIIETATEKGCDLIVMSSHGRRGVRRLMVGSQTAEVVTTTAVPVLVIR